MTFIFIQRNVSEEVNTKNWKEPDFKQADAVATYRPDVIIFEKAYNGRTPSTIYNRYRCENKPIHLVHDYQKWLTRQAKNFGDASSEIPLWDHVVEQWKQGHDIKLYNVDGSNRLRKEFYTVWEYMYPCAQKNWLWWVRIYLREKYMAQNVQWVLERHTCDQKVVVAVFLQNFHWKHVQFLLNNPTKDEIWKYYFGNFKGITRDNITEKIKEQNKVFYKYWLDISDFV